MFMFFIFIFFSFYNYRSNSYCIFIIKYVLLLHAEILKLHSNTQLMTAAFSYKVSTTVDICLIVSKLISYVLSASGSG